MTTTVSYGEVLDVIDQMPVEQQAELVEVVRQRLAARGRERLVAAVRESREEHAAGKSRVGTVEEIMREIEA